MTITNGHELVSAEWYAQHGPPHDIWSQLRAESPVHLCETGIYEPFWAITRHHDIVEVSRRPTDFISEPGITLLTKEQMASQDESIFGEMKVVIQTDPPEHRDLRRVAAPIFTPRAIMALDSSIERSATEVIDALADDAGGGECDFASDIAAAHPLRVLCEMLGVGRDMEGDVLRLTNELFASEDPELQRSGEDRQQAIMELGAELYALFDEIIQDRRAEPKDDLASVLANATIDGEPLDMMETVGYYLIIFSAGHDTTKNALVGGMTAMLDHPEQFDLLKSKPELVDSAVEEMIRWSSPVNYMKRTAAVDTEIGGQPIASGDSLVMFYASANRDDEVFDDPFEFRIDRDPNRHLGFGIGEHYCLGASMARRSARAILLELARRVDSMESTGDPEYISSPFIVGLKHLPIRSRFAS